MTKWLMMSSALIMGGVGALCSLMPQEVLHWTGASASVQETLLVQVLGALYFGFAMINWMGKSNLIGGIFGRPVAFGNFAHFGVAALAITKVALIYPGNIVIWLTATTYALFAFLFGFIIFRHPSLRQCA
jgi:hypothetical protein